MLSGAYGCSPGDRCLPSLSPPPHGRETRNIETHVRSTDLNAISFYAWAAGGGGGACSMLSGAYGCSPEDGSTEPFPPSTPEKRET